MTIHWSLFVPGILLLFYPADRLLSARVELRGFEWFQSLEDSPRHRRWWRVPILWLDPLRAFLGTFLLQRALEGDSDLLAAAARSGYLLLLALVGAGIVVQTFTRRGEGDALLAPLGFVAGVTLALTSWPVALFATMLAALGLFAFRQFGAYFFFGPLAIGLLGFVFKVSPLWFCPAAGVFALPVLAALLTHRTLEFPARNATGLPEKTASLPARKRPPIVDSMGKHDESPDAND